MSPGSDFCSGTLSEVGKRIRIMIILVFDTETGGCSPVDNDILQLSYQVVDTDSGELVKEVNH